MALPAAGLVPGAGVGSADAEPTPANTDSDMSPASTSPALRRTLTCCAPRRLNAPSLKIGTVYADYRGLRESAQGPTDSFRAAPARDATGPPSLGNVFETIRPQSAIHRSPVAKVLPVKLNASPRKLLDISRLERLGWKPSIELRAGIESTYQWFLAQADADLRGVAHGSAA